MITIKSVVTITFAQRPSNRNGQYNFLQVKENNFIFLQAGYLLVSNIKIFYLLTLYIRKCVYVTVVGKKSAYGFKITASIWRLHYSKLLLIIDDIIVYVLETNNIQAGLTKILKLPRNRLTETNVLEEAAYVLSLKSKRNTIQEKSNISSVSHYSRIKKDCLDLTGDSSCKFLSMNLSLDYIRKIHSSNSTPGTNQNNEQYLRSHLFSHELNRITLLTVAFSKTLCSPLRQYSNIDQNTVIIIIPTKWLLTMIHNKRRRN